MIGGSMSEAQTLANRTHMNWAPIALTAIGAIMAGLAVNSAMQPAELPYKRTIVDAAPETYSALSLPASDPAMSVKKLEWRVSSVREPIATAVVATDADGRHVPLDWQNNVTEPVFAADLRMTEVSKVLAAIREHVPENAVVLSWWDLSRKIRLVAQRQAPLDDPYARGLILPTAWQSASGLIDEQENTYWGKGVSEADGKKFTHYIDALLLDEIKGADALRALVPDGKDVYVAVHLSDIWKAAASRHDQIGIAYKDIPSGGQSHSVMKAAKDWIREQKIEGGYAVEPVGNAVRLHYFTGKDSSNLLLAKLLPFSTSNPMQLERFELVYQHRGFWVYKLKG